jgi:hypothetical protein
MPGFDVAFLVIVTTSVRLTYSGDGFVLICTSDLLSIFKLEFSVHALALFHFASQSVPAWHKISAGFDKLASSEPPPPAQPASPRRMHAIGLKRKTRTAIPLARSSLKQFRQLGDVRRDPPALIAGHQSRHCAAPRLHGRGSFFAADNLAVSPKTVPVVGFT